MCGCNEFQNPRISIFEFILLFLPPMLFPFPGFFFLYRTVAVPTNHIILVVSSGRRRKTIIAAQTTASVAAREYRWPVPEYFMIRRAIVRSANLASRYRFRRFFLDFWLGLGFFILLGFFAFTTKIRGLLIPSVAKYLRRELARIERQYGAKAT